MVFMLKLFLTYDGSEAHLKAAEQSERTRFEFRWQFDYHRQNTAKESFALAF